MKDHGQVLTPLKATLLKESEFYRRFEINRSYMLSLKTENLLQNYYLECGLISWSFLPQDIHGGW